MNTMTDIANLPGDARDYDRIAKAIEFLVADRAAQPTLEDIAAHVHLSPFHFQRLFKRWAGVSPKQFAEFLTVEYAKAALERSQSILTASCDAGLSGASRLHDMFVNVEAMSPGEYKAQGRDLVIQYGIHATPFGPMLALLTPRGICGLDFIGEDGAEAAVAQARARWPLSRFVEDAARTGEAVARIFDRTSHAPQRLLLRGTNFQIQVWSALLRVPAGSIVSYGDIARTVCTTKASRAVGTALAQNSIAYLVPCHRVLRATGLFKNYRWGATRRRAMLAWEAAQTAPESP
jgi:AraC family transcriptional regulator of adaptative response/methylated-DNA-[protein]-cysteine methyltransferase